MAMLILKFYDMTRASLADVVNINKLVSMPVRERIGRIKYVPESKLENEYNDIVENISREIDNLKKEAAENA